MVLPMPTSTPDFDLEADLYHHPLRNSYSLYEHLPLVNSLRPLELSRDNKLRPLHAHTNLDDGDAYPSYILFRHYIHL